jgi:hypothetical protein
MDLARMLQQETGKLVEDIASTVTMRCLQTGKSGSQLPTVFADDGDKSMIEQVSQAFGKAFEAWTR